MPDARAALSGRRKRRLRWPIVRRSTHERVVAGWRQRHDVVRQRHDVVWLDHLARCNCHDAWDQCEHSASGHRTPLPEGHTVYEACGCCLWCGNPRGAR